MFLLPYDFTAPVETYDFETYAYTVVYLPEDLSGTDYYTPGSNAREEAIKNFLKPRWKDKYKL